MVKLLPAKNLRFKKIRVCATCKYIIIGNGYVECKRERGIAEDTGEMFHWIMACDGWRIAKND